VCIPAIVYAQETAEQVPVYLEADSVTQDTQANRFIAEGAVEARYGDRTIRADQLIYYPDRDYAEAIGNVTIVEADGTVSFAERAELSANLDNAMATGFSARLSNRTTIGAAYLTRGGDGVNELEQAFYTACRGCNAQGETTTPTWRLKARRVTQDPASEMIHYRNVVLEVKGVPVLYAPYFSHADPSVGRKSGFLLPEVGESSRTGTFAETPYYWNLGPSQDLTIAPRFMTNAAPLVRFEHRKRFHSGETLFQGSLTREQEFDDDGVKFDEEKLRGHIFGDGAFAISDHWSVGFGLERVLGDDDLFFRRYEIDDSDAQRGLYRRGSRRLMSHVYGLRSTPDSITTVSSIAFQGLRVNDDEDEFPTVLPLANWKHAFNEPYVGGRVETSASAVGLQRAEGVDSRRVSAEVTWRKPVALKSGVLIESFANARADVYSVGDFTTASGDVVGDEVITRGLGYVGTEISYPLGKRQGNFDIVIEPVAQLIAAPTGGNDERIPNQDSTSFDLDEGTLFEPNRSPGYDLWEDGARATLGARAEIRSRDRNRAASLFLGQSFRADDESPFSPVTGLSDSVSDIVGEVALQINRRNTVSTRFRLDNDDLNIQRLETTFRLGAGPASLVGKYIDLGDNTLPDQTREEVTLGAELQLARHWSTYYRVQRDLEEDQDRRSLLGLVYRDDCTRVELVYKKEEFLTGDVGSGESIKLQFTLATLGSFGQNR
jgi:LPS-assembly protein